MADKAVIPAQKLLYTISVYTEDTIMTDHTQKNKQFVVTGEELQKMFASKITFVAEPGLRWAVQDGKRKTCLLEIPRQKAPRHIGYLEKGQKEHLLELYMPAMAFRFDVVTDNNLQESICNLQGWCFSGQLKESTNLYEIPLPNFSRSGLCTGTANKKHSGTLRETVEQIVFDSWFNNHIDLCGKKKLRFLDFYRQCKGRVRLNHCNLIGKGRDILSPRRH